MATLKVGIKEQYETSEKIHALLHRNLYLLSLNHPMNSEFSTCYREGMLKKPNSLAFNQCALYLMCTINPETDMSDMSLLISQPKMANQFRRTFLSFVEETMEKHKGYISPIMPSWLVTAGGHRVARLLFQLSQVALKTFVIKHAKDGHNPLMSFLDSDGAVPVVPQTAVDQIKNSLASKTFRLCKLSENNQKLYRLYDRQLKFTEECTNVNTETLNHLMHQIKSESPSIDSKILEDMADVMTPSDVLTECDNYIETRITALETEWKSSSLPFLDVVEECENVCRRVAMKYTRESESDTLLRYDPKNVNVIERDDESSDSILNSTIDTVRNNVLHFPSLLKAFNVLLYENLPGMAFFNLDIKYSSALIEKVRSLDIIRAQTEDIKMLIEKLEKGRTKTQNDFSERNEWIIEALSL